MSACVWVIAFLGVKEVALRESVDELQPAEASAGAPATAPLPQRRHEVDSDAMSTDFMPLDGWDHVELWVGNAKQAAYYYEHAFGFRRTAYAGPETGVRDRASYVLEQGEIRLVLTSALRRDHEVGQFSSSTATA